MNKLQAFRMAVTGAWSAFKAIYLGLQTINKEQLDNLDAFEASVKVYVK